MYYVDDGTRSDLLEVFDEGSGVASVSVRRVDTLRRKVVELLEVSIHHNLLLVSVLERLGAREATF